MCSTGCPGAAAVLIDRAHTFRDLFLPINATQKRFFDSIDGKRRIEDIVQTTSTPIEQTRDVDLARSFFEQLWWQDQVVFDTSGLRTDIS